MNVFFRNPLFLSISPSYSLLRSRRSGIQLLGDIFFSPSIRKRKTILMSTCGCHSILKDLSWCIASRNHHHRHQSYRQYVSQFKLVPQAASRNELQYTASRLGRNMVCICRSCNIVCFQRANLRRHSKEGDADGVRIGALQSLDLAHRWAKDPSVQFEEKRKTLREGEEKKKLYRAARTRTNTTSSRKRPKGR